MSTVDPLLVVLAAGKPFRGVSPSILQAGPGQLRIFDWIVKTTEPFKAEAHIIGGYEFERVVAAYPDLQHTLNPYWEQTRSTYSFLCAPLQSEQITFVAYSDVLIRRQAATLLAAAEGDVVVAVDSNWRERYEQRAAEDINRAEVFDVADGVVHNFCGSSAEFAGVVKFSDKAMALIVDHRESLKASLKMQHLPALLEWISGQGCVVKGVDVSGQWAELNAPQDVARFVLGTKAETIERLRSLVRRSSIGVQVKVRFEDWQQQRSSCVQQIQAQFPGSKVVVRSSARQEDSWDSSMAGCFHSELNVPTSDSSALEHAVNKVFESYPDTVSESIVFIQEMVQNVVRSGVAMTRSVETGAPYYVINYTDGTSTSAVTAGVSKVKTFVYSRACSSVNKLTEEHRVLLEAIKEIEQLVLHDSLDIEFALSRTAAGLTVHVLQVRPMVFKDQWQGDDALVSGLLDDAERDFEDLQSARPFLYGSRTLMGIMPDWNPAELIGVKPRPLALDLYRHLITDSVWAAQRAEFGYRDVRPHPLLREFVGTPYIDVRVCFNSYIPAGLDSGIAERLFEFYLQGLQNRPDFHDKVEFDVLYTCVDFSKEKKSQELKAAGFSDAEIIAIFQELRTITSNAFLQIERSYEEVEFLRQRYDQVIKCQLPPLEKAFLLLGDLQRYGTLSFAHLARCAFVAMSLLKTAVAEGLLSEHRYHEYLGSLTTVMSELNTDALRVNRGEFSWDEFIQLYGHLRPGTYDVCSPTYKENDATLLRDIVSAARERPLTEVFKWEESESTRLVNGLRQLGLETSFENLDSFLRRAIEGREYSKFIFTRNLSAFLDFLHEGLAPCGISRDDISYLKLSDVRQISLGESLPDRAQWLEGRIGMRRHRYGVTRGLELPPLILKKEDFKAFEYPANIPNYIGSGQISAELVHLGSQSMQADIKGKIVLIAGADPGYDWIFAHSPAGLITAYGGANSHMAIRAAEYQIPAAVGVGQETYKRLLRVKRLLLHCAERRMEIIQ